MSDQTITLTGETDAPGTLAQAPHMLSLLAEYAKHHDFEVSQQLRALADLSLLRDVKFAIPHPHAKDNAAPMPSDVQGSATNLFNELAKIVSKAGRVLDIELESAEQERRASQAHAERVRQQAGG